MKRVALVLVFLVLSVAPLLAQQNPLYSQYMFNHMVINPAYAGTKPYMSLTGIVRKQWMGFEGSPLTGSVSFHGPMKNRKMGLGVLLNNDHIGIIDQTDLYGNYSYQVGMGKGKLSLGLSGGVSFYSSNVSELVVWDGGDPVYNANSINDVLPNFGAGAYYYSEKFYLGLSTPQLLSYNSNDKLSVKKQYIHHPSPHYYLTSGFVIETKGLTKIKPSALVRYVKGAPVSFDVNVNVLLNEILWLGVSYRHNDAVVGMVEYQLSRKLRFGYAYEYTTTEMRNVVGSTHEVMLAFDFGYDILKIKNPRYF